MPSSVKSRTQIKRERYDYRGEYLKHNPGIFGFIYICSQCGKPMTKSQLQVDHIAPISRMGLNHKINCVAICPVCNKKKSNKYGVVTVKGLIAKVIEEVLLISQKLFLYALMALYYILKATINLLLMPIVNARSLPAQIGFIGLYTLVANWYLKTSFGLDLLGMFLKLLNLD